VLVFASWLALPETHPPERRMPFRPSRLVGTSWQIASHREFALLAFSAAFNFSAVLGFIGAAPAIVLEHWGLSETQFGWLFVPLIAGFMIGATLSGRLAGRVASHKQVNAGFAMTLAGTGSFFVLHSILDGPPLAAQQVLLLAVGLGAQLAFPVLTLRMLDLFPRARGSAASVQSFIALTVASVMMGFMVPALHGSLATLGLGTFAASVIAVVLWRIEQQIRPIAVVREDAVGPPDL
jgi:DHA1 family bicyclomycin/chloramphenicol resistance-like MFS transporter